MNTKILLPALAGFFILGCATQKNAESFYAKHPEQLAASCAEKYPVKDSVGATVTDSTAKADNKDFTSSIDSANNAVESLVNAVNNAKKRSVDSVSLACLDVVADYNRQIDQLETKANDLAGQVKHLQANYRPCIPDTVYRTTPVYRENTAKVAAQAGQIAALSNQLAVMTASRDDWKGKAKFRWWIILGLGLIIGGAIAWRFK